MPKVRAGTAGEGNLKCTVHVWLKPGQSVCATRDPVYFSENLGFSPAGGSPVAGAVRWEGADGGEMCFGIEEAGVARLDIAKGPFVIASRLILLWSGEVQFEPPDMPDVPGFTRAYGSGAAWLLMPGAHLSFPYGKTVMMVDPARLAWARISDTLRLSRMPGPGGRTWLRITGAPLETLDVQLHSGSFPTVPAAPGTQAQRVWDARPPGIADP